MSDNRELGERGQEQQGNPIKMEQIRTIPGGAMVRTMPPQQRFIMAPQVTTALISSTTTIQAQVLPKVTVQGGSSNVSRISAVPMQSAATSTGTFHVPKGPAAVANISVPRSSNVATPMVRNTSLQAMTVASHSLPGSIATTATTMQIGRPVAPWVGISTQQTVPRQTTQQIRSSVQQISDPIQRHSFPMSTNQNLKKRTLVCYDDSSSDDDQGSFPMIPKHKRLVPYNSSDDESVDNLSGTKISGQIRPMENQRMLVHSSSKQVITQQAQVHHLTAGGPDPSKGQTTVLKSYGGANTTARLVPPAPGLSRITTIPPAMAVSLHSAAVLVPNSGIPVKTTIAQPKVVTQSVHSSTSVQFPTVCSASVQPALALNTVQVSRPGPGKPPALVTVMLSPSITAAAGSHPSGVTHIKPLPPQGGSPQLLQQAAGPSAGQSTITKLYTDNPHTMSASSQPVFIQTQGPMSSHVTPKPQQLPATLIVREQPRCKEEPVSVTPGGAVNIHGGGTVYNLTGGPYYEGQSYLKVPQHQSAPTVSVSPNSNLASVQMRQSSTQMPPMSSSVTSTPTQAIRINPVMVVDHSRSQIQQFAAAIDTSTGMTVGDTASIAALALTSQALKQNTSPRPSILRKREPEGSPMKVTKNLAPVLAGLTVSAGSPPGPPGSPKRPESGQSGQSSSGSTTISANSSPGESPVTLKQEPVDDEPASNILSTRPLIPTVLPHPLPSSCSLQPEMSPRKKPRKQQLSGNQITNEPTFSEDEMEFITEDKIKKEIKEEPSEESEKAKPQKNMSLLSSYKHNWKGRNNHFNRYTDVKPKEDRKPTLSEIANQKNVMQKLTGWKVYHIATHLEDLVNNETDFFGEYNTTLNFLEDKVNKCKNREIEKDFNRITERVRANFQRSRVVKDHMVEAKTQLFKLLEHRTYISDIINRNTIKRPLKKRERL